MAPKPPPLLAAKFPHRLHSLRTFINARVKWVPDPFLDDAVSKEKNLKQILSFKNQLVHSPSKSLPLSSLSLLKPHLDLPTTTALKFFQKYPSFFTLFQPCPSLPLHVKLTPQALTLHKEESAIHGLPAQRDDAVRRLAKLLMLTNAGKLPFYVINRFKFDLGLPYNYVTSLLADYPEYFQVCEVKDSVANKEVLALELVSWRKELAVSEMERRSCGGDLLNLKKGMCLRFSMNFPRGFDLEKRVMNWVEQWQDLPYISPYEDAFHFAPSGGLAEKWAVAMLHELLWLLVSKKTERDNLLCLGDYLGFGDRFKKALRHHPGIFYVSNKIRTQTVVLREAYRKDFLVERHPSMGMRHRYIHLMNKSNDRRKPVGVVAFGSQRKTKVNLCIDNDK
ncbi:PORR domain-containing protein [Citrus sinensis]|uniref:PORR domain-containing protein n=2 Tax=Citrus sinensis TaxID=2711 RepID=A0ACB8K9S0_CITSI|nr:PORR domain-containing protein [Citrus sinensis]